MRFPNTTKVVTDKTCARKLSASVNGGLNSRKDTGFGGGHGGGGRQDKGERVVYQPNEYECRRSLCLSWDLMSFG